MDFNVSNHGTIFLLTPLTPEAHDWITENISEIHTTFGDAVVVEHRYISDIVDGIRDDELSIE